MKRAVRGLCGTYKNSTYMWCDSIVSLYSSELATVLVVAIDPVVCDSWCFTNIIDDIKGMEGRGGEGATLLYGWDVL